MRRLAQIASVLLTLPFVLSGYAEAAEPTVINLSCDGTLTGTYGTDKPKSMEASQKISVVVDLDDQTVFFLGYVVPIYDVDQASINFGGRQAVDYGFSIIIRGHVKRTSDRQCVFRDVKPSVYLKPLAPAIVQRHDARFEPCRGHELQAQ